MTVMTLYGWSLSQWAEAVCYARRFEPHIDATVDGSRKVYSIWRSNRADDPGGLKLIDTKPITDFGWAANMMFAAAKEFIRYV